MSLINKIKYLKMGWNDFMYAQHNFNHSRYNAFVGWPYNMKLDLEQ
jgi:hypothetical protein